MWRLLIGFWRRLIRALSWRAAPTIVRPPASPERHTRTVPRIPIERYDGDADPPALRWKPCHPRTAQKFKAHMTCDVGHPIVLKDHTIFADGNVHPSVICRTPCCQFHDFVVLREWTGGEIPA